MVAEERTWSPPLTQPAAAPKPEDRDSWEERLGVSLDFSEFVKGGFWDVDDVLRPIYQEASDVVGRDFPYPSDDSQKK